MIKSGQLIRIYTQGTTKAPASHHTTRAGGVEARGGGRRAEEGTGAGVHWYLTAKDAKTAKDFTAMALRP